MSEQAFIIRRGEDGGQERRETESEALSLAFDWIRAGGADITILRPEGTAIAHDQILTMMAAD
jgi:hypothetical protein